MRSIIYSLAFFVTLGLCFWAYHQHYQTRATLREAKIMRTEIIALKDMLTLQRAEWAYLNRPDHLRQLATAYFERLQLLPLEAVQLKDISSIPFPPSAQQDIVDQPLNVDQSANGLLTTDEYKRKGQ